VNTIVSGIRMETLANTGETHSFLSDQDAKSPHQKPQSWTGTRKVLKCAMILVMGIVHSTPLRVEDWFGNMDLFIALLEYHAVILGLDFLILSKESRVIHNSFLVLLDEDRTPRAPLNMKRKLGRMPTNFVTMLLEGDNGSTDEPCKVT
jgi:hypothetical protein